MESLPAALSIAEKELYVQLSAAWAVGRAITGEVDVSVLSLNGVRTSRARRLADKSDDAAAAESFNSVKTDNPPRSRRLQAADVETALNELETTLNELKTKLETTTTAAAITTASGRTCIFPFKYEVNGATTTYTTCSEGGSGNDGNGSGNAADAKPWCAVAVDADNVYKCIGTCEQPQLTGTYQWDFCPPPTPPTPSPTPSFSRPLDIVVQILLPSRYKTSDISTVVSQLERAAKDGDLLQDLRRYTVDGKELYPSDVGVQVVSGATDPTNVYGLTASSSASFTPAASQEKMLVENKAKAPLTPRETAAPTTAPDPSAGAGKAKKKVPYDILLYTGAGILFLLIAGWVYCCCCTGKKKKKGSYIEDSAGRGGPPPQYMNDSSSAFTHGSVAGYASPPPPQQEPVKFGGISNTLGPLEVYSPPGNGNDYDYSNAMPATTTATRIIHLPQVITF